MCAISGLLKTRLAHVRPGQRAGALLAYFGIVANEFQAERSLLGITLMFSVVPAVFALIKAWAIWVYPLDAKKMQEIEQGLAERHAAQYSK